MIVRISIKATEEIYFALIKKFVKVFERKSHARLVEKLVR